MSLLAQHHALMAAQQPGFIVPQGLIFYLPMGVNDIIVGDIGSELKDRSGNGHDGAFINMDASNIVAAPFNQALSFNETDEYVDHGLDVGAEGLTAMTINWWQRWRTNLVAARIFSQWDVGTQMFRVNLGGDYYDKLSYGFRDSSLTERSGTFSLNVSLDDVFVDDGVMRMHTIIWNGGSGVEAYRNSTEQLYDVPLVSGAVTSLAPSTEHMLIGAKYSGGAPISLLESDIGETRFYNRAITTSEIAELYALGAP